MQRRLFIVIGIVLAVLAIGGVLVVLSLQQAGTDTPTEGEAESGQVQEPVISTVESYCSRATHWTWAGNSSRSFG